MATSATDAELIARFLAEKGVTRCPPAAATVTSTSALRPSAALSAHEREQEESSRSTRPALQRRKRPEHIWTPARRNLALGEFALGTPINVIYEKVCALPGPPPGKGTIAIVAARAGVRRPKSGAIAA